MGPWVRDAIGKFHLSPIVQYVMNRLGQDDADDFWVLGVRLQVDF